MHFNKEEKMKPENLTTNFRSRVKKEPIKTSRFLWHVTNNDCSTNLFIANYGLLCEDNYAVFAHQNVANFNDTYPFCIDSIDFNLNSMPFPGAEFLGYAFWRIDTYKLNQFDWFIDPNMENDYTFYCNTNVINPLNFVCTFNTIPNYALKLFTLDIERYNSKQSFVKFSEGVANCSPYKNDFDALAPEYKINNYIQWKTNP
jgi:hypothetical protein